MLKVPHAICKAETYLCSVKMRTFSSSMLGLRPSVLRPCAAVPDEDLPCVITEKWVSLLPKRVSGRGKEMQDEDTYKGTRILRILILILFILS